MPAQDEISHIRKLSQQFAYTSLQMHQAIGKQAGLPGTDHKYLGFLLQRGAMTAGELATVTGLTTGAVTSLVDRLEKKALVKRQPDKTDRRKMMVAPDMDKIKALLKPLYQDFRTSTEALFATFTSEELKTLERYFLHATEIMEQKIQTLKEKK